MRSLIMGAALLALAACGSEQQAAQNGCARSATHEVDFTNSAAPDVFTASADGPSCDQAFVTLSLRSGDGAPLMIHSAVYQDIKYGGAPPTTSEATTREQMDEFLSGWANVSALTTNEMPAWPESAASLADVGGTFSYHSDLPREAYEMLRERNGPMLCYAAGAETSRCIVIDPATNLPIEIAAFGP